MAQWICLFFVMGAHSQIWATLQPKLIQKTASQGQVVLIRMDSPTGAFPRSVSARLGEKEQTAYLWDCYPKRKSRCFMVAVPLDAPATRTPLKLSWSVGDDWQTETLSVAIKKGSFHVNRLKVDPSLTSPSPEEKKRMAQDRLDIQAAYARLNELALWKGNFILPTPGSITSRFGNLRTYNGLVTSQHMGVDLRADPKTPIFAGNAGKVVLAKDLVLAGNMVLLEHGKGLYSHYAHLSRIAVDLGEWVNKGQKLGMAGSTGRVTGPHLHWGVRVNGFAVDPHQFRSVFNSALNG